MSVLSDMKRLGKLDILIKNNYEIMDDFFKIKSFEISDKFVVSSKYFPELAEKNESQDVETPTTEPDNADVSSQSDAAPDATT